MPRTRRNLLFDRAARRWKVVPPPYPFVAAGVTNAARCAGAFAQGQSPEVTHNGGGGAATISIVRWAMMQWDELGRAGGVGRTGVGPCVSTRCGRCADARPQYHLNFARLYSGAGWA